MQGHEVFVEKEAGVGSSILDDDFVAAGATILDTADAVWETGDLILKVKEPIAEEYPGCGRARRSSRTSTSPRTSP